MKIYVLPVSGGGFAVQMAFLKSIFEATKGEKTPGIKPDLVLASSGGNVAAYMAMIGDWSDSDMMKNSHVINSTLFVESWTPSFFPTWIAFPLTKSLYRNGSGIQDLFHHVYTPASIDKTEIWSGTYNTTTHMSSFFCNRHLENALIKDRGEKSYIYDKEPGKYLNNNISLIAKACHASASIPIITEGVVIKKNLYIDGGLGFASPFTPLSPKLTEIIKTRNVEEPIQIYHFSSYNMDQIFSDSMYSNSIGLLIHSSLIQDRASVVNYLSQHGKVNPIPQIHHDVNSKILGDIIGSLKNKSYVMSLSPKTSHSVNLTSFVGKDVVKIIKDSENDYTVMIWVISYRY